MLLNKLAALVKRSRTCLVVEISGEMWLGTGNALYRASALPRLQSDEQVRAVLSIRGSEWGRIKCLMRKMEDKENVFGMDLSDTGPGDLDTIALNLTVTQKAKQAVAVRARGELLFYDPSTISPVADELSQEYGRLLIRRMPDGRRFLVAANGMETVAAIMPMSILNEEFLAELSDFHARCMEQNYRDSQEIDLGQEAQKTAEER